MASVLDPSRTEGADRSRGDYELACAARAGDPEALHALLQRLRCVPRVLAALNSRAGSPLGEHDLADLAQDTIILVWQKLGTFREHGALEPWAYGIARFEFQNLARRRRRAARRQVELEIDDQPDSAGDPYFQVDLESWLAGLSREQADVVRLKHQAGLTFDEIAVRLAINTNTAKTRYYRALRAIEAGLEERAHEDGGPGGQAEAP